MEEVNIRNVGGQAKVVGTLISISGALVFTFWKAGIVVKLVPFMNKPPLLPININYNSGERRHVDDWIKGSALIFISQISWSGMLILQGVVTKVYTAPITLTLLVCFFATLQSLMLAPFFAPNLALWSLHCNQHL